LNGLAHFEPEVIALARPLADTGEHRNAGVLNGDVADQLLHRDRLADSCAAEQTNLTAL
jgi:hypothetical protein